MTSAVAPPESPAFRAAIAAQADAADPANSAWVSANAGSGKTKVLIDRVARLLLRGAPPDSILCVTYTKAAASEMLDRLFERLGAWSVMDEGALVEKLAALEDRAPASYSKPELDAARALFARALETPGGLRIETIHAFCSRVLRRFPLEAGVSPGFKEIEEAETDALWLEAASYALARADDEDRNALDTLALESGAAGAMGGLEALKHERTRIQRFLSGRSIDAALGDLRDHIRAPDATPDEIMDRAMGTDLPRAALCDLAAVLSSGGKTDAATAQKIEIALSAGPAETRWCAYLSIFQTSAGAWRSANPYTKASADLAGPLFQLKEVPEGSEVRRMRAAHADLLAAQAYARTAALLHVGAPALNRYEALKRRRGALDFDDLIQRTGALLSAPGAAPWVLYKLDGGLTHVLLDEAQDTSPNQWSLINALTAEFFAGEGVERGVDPRTLFVVGDEKQSIYSFQGADPNRFRTERQAFTEKARSATGEAVLPDMTMSFRSSPEILDFVDAVINAAPPLVADPSQSEPPADADLSRHVARRANQPGLVEFLPLDPPEELVPADPWQAPVDALGSESPKARLARKVAAWLRSVIGAGETVWEETPDRTWRRRAAHPGDVLILVQNRTGGLFDALIGALKAEGLPVAGADRLVLKNHIGVQDCLNLIRFVLLPEDDLTLAEILRGPFGDLLDDDAHLFPLAFGRGADSLWSRLQASKDPAHAPLQTLLSALLERKSLPAFEFLSTALDQPGPDGRTGWARLLSRLGAPARDPVEALLARAAAHDATGPASLQSFLQRMETDEGQIKRDLAAPGRMVRVMTVHGAKGLQAPIVILPDTTRAPKTGGGPILDVGGAPVWSPSAATDTDAMATARAAAAMRAEAEHRRLLYVALTRAQDRLLICGAWAGRTGNGASGRAEGSWHALCEAGLDRLNATSSDEIRKYGAPPPSLPAAVVDDADETMPDWLNQEASKERAGPRLAAPSSLLRERAPALAPRSADRAARLTRGRLIHALLQRLPDLPEDERAAAAAAFLAARADFDDAQRREMAQAALRVLNDSAFAPVFGPGGRAEAAVIGAAPDVPAGVVINGRVDRLRVTDDAVLIVEFKTDRPAPADVSGVDAAYIAQLAAYRSVLRTAYPGRTVGCALVWTDGPKLMTVPDAAMDQIFSTVSLAV